MTDFLSNALLVFTGMVFLIWVLPGMVYRQNHPIEDREGYKSMPRLRLHPRV
jgi:hypothetical protein